MKVGILHCDVAREDWHNTYLREFTYKHFPDYNINYELVYHGEKLPDLPYARVFSGEMIMFGSDDPVDPNEIDLIDFSEFCNPWHEEVAKKYNVPIVCSTEEGSLNSLNTYLTHNNIDVEFMLSRIKHFIARSSWTRDMLMFFGINGDNISIIPYGTDLDNFKPSNKAEEPSFLYVGSVNKQKGVHHLIESYLKNVDKTDWKLKLVVGEFNNDEDLLEKIRNLAEKNNKIELIPFPPINELPMIYHEASCFVLPQDWGSVLQFGYPLVWAISCGLPAISLDQGAARDYIRDGENGFLCKNTQEIARRMLKIAKMDTEELRLRGSISRNIAEMFFNPNIIARKYKKVYEGVLS